MPRRSCDGRIEPRISELARQGSCNSNQSAVEFCEEWSLIYDIMLMFELDKKPPACEPQEKGLSCPGRDRAKRACRHTSAQAVVPRIDGEW